MGIIARDHERLIDHTIALLTFSTAIEACNYSFKKGAIGADSGDTAHFLVIVAHH